MEAANCIVDPLIVAHSVLQSCVSAELRFPLHSNVNKQIKILIKLCAHVFHSVSLD